MPASIQREVYATVGKRRTRIDASWAPWWRAQARAIHAVALIQFPGEALGIELKLKRELAFADRLEGG